MKTARLIVIAVAVLPALASAETVYLTDQWSIPLRADATPGAAAVKMVTTGTAFEVLERGVGLVRVRDPQGVEGWIEASALSAQPPASTQVRGLRTELERTRAQLVQAQAQVDQARAQPAATDAGTAQLRAELNTVRQQLVQTQGDLKKKDEELASLTAEAAKAPPDTVGESTPATIVVREGGFSYLWLGIAFAMLVLGFIGGMVWVREGIRRRMGGLYLRI